MRVLGRVAAVALALAPLLQALPVAAQTSASTSFYPTGQAYLTASTSSSNTPLISLGPTAYVVNNGTVTVYVRFGGSNVTAAVNDPLSYPINAGSGIAFNVGSNVNIQYIAAVTASSTANLAITTGTGVVTGGGSGGGGGGGVVTGNVSNASTLANSSTNIGAVSYNYGQNGTNWNPISSYTFSGANALVVDAITGGGLLAAINGPTPGAVTTAAPTYGTGTTQPLSLDTSGNLRVLVAGTVPVSGTVTVNQAAATTGGANVTSKQVANNTTSVAICASACTLYGIFVQNNSATIAYLKLYNAAQGSTTCGSGTPVDRLIIPANTSGAGAVVPMAGGIGVAYGTALTACTTTGIADADTTAPAASTYLESFFTK